MFKIAIVGSPDTINGFKLLGVETRGAKNSEDALEILKKLKSEKSEDIKKEEEASCLYAIIFITEDLAEKIDTTEMKKLEEDVMPAIIPLPSHLGTTGYGNIKLRRIVEQAVGSDILGDK